MKQTIPILYEGDPEPIKVEIISKIMTTMSLEYDIGFIGSFHGNTSSRQ
jgi:hypothetical protein